MTVDEFGELLPAEVLLVELFDGVRNWISRTLA